MINRTQKSICMLNNCVAYLTQISYPPRIFWSVSVRCILFYKYSTCMSPPTLNCGFFHHTGSSHIRIGTSQHFSRNRKSGKIIYNSQIKHAQVPVLHFGPSVTLSLQDHVSSRGRYLERRKSLSAVCRLYFGSPHWALSQISCAWPRNPTQ